MQQKYINCHDHGIDEFSICGLFQVDDARKPRLFESKLIYKLETLYQNSMNRERNMCTKYFCL